MPGRAHQGCPQDVKSQDRDETETVNLQDRDDPFFKLLRPTFHFPKLSRPRRDETFSLQDRDETFQKKSPDRLETDTQDRDIPKNV